MTDKTRQDSGGTHIIRYALELGLLWIDGDGRDKVREALDALATLEAQLEAIGAGGVSGPLMGRAYLSANAGEPVAWRVRRKDAPNYWIIFMHYPVDAVADPEREVQALFAAPPTAQAEGWRPIETAPKDGTSVLAVNAATNPGRQHIVRFEDRRPHQPWRTGAGPMDWAAGLTHWMPLPPPPTSAEEVEHG